jgi:sigma-B regulation protein RsbU (phosphoserine phosphatase)
MLAAVDDPVLHAILRAAVDITMADAGWILARDGGTLTVAAAAGTDIDTAQLAQLTIDAGSGTAGFVIASGQPLALSAGANDPRLSEGVAVAIGRRPSTVLCVACEAGDAIVGALELIDKSGGAAFSFDDVELATLLASIGAVALLADRQDADAVATPAQLGAGLQRLADAEPSRYASIAVAVEALLERG